MKRKNLIILCAAIVTASLMMTGCQNSAQTEEEIVIPKEEGTQGEEGETFGEEEVKTAAKGAIADQVQAPEQYTFEGGNEQISVKVDAAVIVPEGDGFQSYKVTSRPFSQEDYDKVSRVLLKGEKLWNRDMQAMGASNGFTASEIDERIARLEAKKETAEAKGSNAAVYDSEKEKSYDEIIEEWNVMREQAPEEIFTVEVPTTVTFTESSEYLESNCIEGTATVDGYDYFVHLDNNIRDDWKCINFGIENGEYNSNFTFGADRKDIQTAGISAGEAKEMALVDMEAMEFTDFALAGEEYLTSVTAYEEEDEVVSTVGAVGYTVYFTRLLDGIPVTYTHETGGSLEGSEDAPWLYEELKLVYTKDGFAQFSWWNPYTIEKTSDEYLFLLPFSEIQNVFEEMIIKKYGDFFEKTDAKVEFEIDEVRLGYMRVIERGDISEGKMIPVWDFFGKQTLIYPDTDEPYVMDWPYESWLTINALDGTIIDRGFGY